MQAFYTHNETQNKKVVFVSAVLLLVCCLLFSFISPSLITLFLKSQV